MGEESVYYLHEKRKDNKVICEKLLKGIHSITVIVSIIVEENVIQYVIGVKIDLNYV